MWEDYSFSEASQRCYDSIDENPSPDSSRGASPLSDDTSRQLPDASYSITQLAQQFENQRLEPRREPPELCSPPCNPHSLHPRTAKDRSAPAHGHHAIKRKRQALIHRQCSAANMAKLSSLIQELTENPAWSGDHHGSAVEGGDLQSTTPPYDGSLQSPTSSIMSTSSSSEDSDLEFRTGPRAQPLFHVGKELKHSSSRDAVGRLHKDIRLRRYVRAKR